ncbi:MAG: leucyl aminopeptidase [Thermoleophilia bacterium]
MLTIEATSAAPQAVECDVLGVPVLDPVDARAGALAALDAALGGKLAHLAEDGELKGGPGKVLALHTLGELAAHRVCLVGAGRSAKVDADSIRTAAARTAATITGLAGGTVAFVVDASLPVPVADQARAIVDGVVLTSFDAGRWKTIDPRPKPITRLVLVGEGLDAVVEDARRAAVVATWANRCRDLVNMPPNELYPARLGEEAVAIADRLDHLACEVMGPERLREERMGALLAVGQGSDNEQRLITLRYEPPNAVDGVVLGIVGKAITFDTGGISIKPSARMEDMKGDMAGGAAALAAAGAIAELGLPLRVITVIPSCENMPDGGSYRPGDILTARNGKTIEVTNTDAEGRLVLADALTWCREQGATHMVDLATLTGAVVIALGDYYAGLMGNDQGWVDRILAAARASGDHAWQLPFHETYRRHIGSHFADFKNSSDLRQAGPVYAASFLAEFTGEGPWAHLDIAGTGSLDRGRGDYYVNKGATGYGVRLLAALAAALAAGS